MAGGVKKIYESVMKDGRVIILTDAAGVRDNLTNIPNGTIYINTSDGAVSFKQTSGWGNLDPAKMFSNLSVVTTLIADKAITSAKILSDVADNSKRAITKDHIKDGEITVAKLAGSITGDKLTAGTITKDQLADNSVTKDQILDGDVISSKILNHATDNSKRAITRNHIQDSEIIEAKLAANAVTSTKILSDVADDAKRAITTNHIKNAAITSEKLAANAVTSSVLSQDASVDANRSVGANHIKNKAVTGRAIADNTIQTISLYSYTDPISNITTGAVATKNLTDACVTDIKLATDSVTKEKIKAATITYDKIAEKTIPLGRLDIALQTQINAAMKSASEYEGNVAYVACPTTYTNEAGAPIDVMGLDMKDKNIINAGSISATKVYNAVFNDLAEGYIPGCHNLIPGDIVEIRHDGKVYRADRLSKKIVGVISDQYAACYGASEEEIKNGTKVAVGLIGKVYVNVIGPVKQGDRIGIIQAGLGYSHDDQHTVGKSLEDKTDEDVGKVLCLIYPN